MRMSASVHPGQVFGSNNRFGPTADLMYTDGDEGDWVEEEDMKGLHQPAYPDTQEFLEELQENIELQDPHPAEDQPTLPTPSTPTQHQNGVGNGVETKRFPMANDYQGMGGPASVPLYSDKAFQKPSVPLVQGNSLLKQMFMEPTDEQILAYHKVYIRDQIATNKQRLKWSIFVHYLLVFVMISKLLPDLLDRLDIFIMEIEELFVPAPYLWEWLWLLSVPVTFFGLSACKKSNMVAIQRFMLGSLVLSLVPILIGMVVHATDVIEFLFVAPSEDDEQDLEQDQTPDKPDSDQDPAVEIFMWQGYPYSVLWYAFFLAAMQVHTAELYFANSLMKIWINNIKKSS